MCVGNVERDGILWVTVVKKGKRYPPGGGDRDRLGKAGGVGVLLTCLLPGHIQPSRGYRIKTEKPPSSRMLAWHVGGPGIGLPAKVGDPSCLITE